MSFQLLNDVLAPIKMSLESGGLSVYLIRNIKHGKPITKVFLNFNIHDVFSMDEIKILEGLENSLAFRDDHIKKGTYVATPELIVEAADIRIVYQTLKTFFRKRKIIKILDDIQNDEL